jgi:tau tubulin kinase
MGEVPQLNNGQIILKYRIEKKLGEGGFGGVYKVTNTENNQLYALKVEGANEQIQLLKMDVAVLEALVAANANRHFAMIYDKGRNTQYNYIVMTLMAKSLQDLKVMNGRPGTFSLSTILRVAVYALEGLEDLHGIGYLHRDVKPGNYANGRQDINEHRKIYVLDFGMARKFISERTGQQRTPRAAAGFRGTVRYAPISCHLQRELCRKDDLEVWLYMCIELTNGKLPWSDIADMNAVGKMKQQVREESSVKMLVGGCPREYLDLMRYIDALKYYDKPSYNQVYQSLRACLTSQGANEMDRYDWEM